MRVLITGGCGFIGSHLAAVLHRQGHGVRILDNLDPQSSGEQRQMRPLPPEAEVSVADVRSPDAVAEALQGVDAVIHLAAAVGTAQSMYQIGHYTSVNCMGTATLLSAIAAMPRRPGRLVVASSMSIYGEGAYQCNACGPVHGVSRRQHDLAAGRWEPRCPRCGEELQAVPTPETHLCMPSTVYAVTKQTQEQLVLSFGRAFGVASVALRFFNVYGPGQQLENPYTGVAAIFAARLLNGQAPVVYEDGQQTRDFVHVSDVAEVIGRTLAGGGQGQVLNVGSGRPATVRQVAELLASHLNPTLMAKVYGQSRAGDIRHCYADLTALQAELGYRPTVSLEAGMAQLAAAIRHERPRTNWTQAHREICEHGLLTDVAR